MIFQTMRGHLDSQNNVTIEKPRHKLIYPEKMNFTIYLLTDVLMLNLLNFYGYDCDLRHVQVVFIDKNLIDLTV